MNTHTLIFATLVALLGACTPLNAVKMDYQTVTVQSATATPRMLVEKGRTQLDFGSGDRRLTFQFSPEAGKRGGGPIAFHPPPRGGAGAQRERTKGLGGRTPFPSGQEK